MTLAPFPPDDQASFVPGSSELAKLIRAFDWASTALGPIDDWPPSLKIATGVVVSSPTPIVMLWGSQGVMIYNDAYSRFAGDRHPDLLGSNVREGWAEVADFNDHVMTTVLAGGTLSYKDQELTLHRDGKSSPVWMNLDYSPVFDDAGKPTGVIAIVVETTQRVLADRRAAAEQERQRQMLRQMPGFVAFLSGPDFVYEFVNDAYVSIAERTDFIGRRFKDVFPDIAGQGFYELLDRVYRTGEGIVSRNMELRLHGREETQFIDFVFEPIRDDSGEVTGIFIGGYEITEAHRATLALRQSETRLRALNAELERQVLERTQSRGRSWQVSPDLMGALNSKGYFETSNPAWKSVLGWSDDEVASMSIFELLHPDDVETTREGFALTQRGQPAIRFPNRYRCKDGSYRWISWVGVPDDGLVYCTGRDITAERETEAERDRLWTLSEDMLARADYDGKLSAVNPAWTKVLGWSEHELLTNPYADIIHPDNVETVVAALAEMGRTGQPTRFENRILASNGAWKPIEWTVSPEPDGTHFIAIGRDISTEKDAAAELARAQEALRQSQKMEAMGQLTGGVAHDFNNLLTPIVGGLDMLQRQNIGGERERRLIDGAMQSADRAKTLVQRLLAFARRQPLQPTAVDIRKLVGDMANLLSSTVGPQIKVAVEADQGLSAARADMNQLEMALLNLGVNARDAMPGGGTLRITADNDHVSKNHRSKLPPGPYVRVSVADTGVGMDSATAARAVEPFFSTKGVGKGTGLGLSMVHGLVSQLGGGLSIESRIGVGTNIELWLPATEGMADKLEAAPNAICVAERKGTALLVDDEDLVRASTAHMLEELGYVVVEARSGEDALRLVNGGLDPDLIVTDHLMPGMSGTELAHEIRANRPRLPVLVISGYADAAAVDASLPRLTKPFRSADLAASLAEIGSSAES